jgi:DNA-binding NtrC family response regulator
MKLLCGYSWPGNIRELENAIEQAVVLSNQPVLAPDDLPPAVRNNAGSRLTQTRPPNGQFLFPDTPTLEEVKKRYVLYVLERNQGNVARTARALNIDRRSLYRMLERYKIEPFFKHE